MRGACLVRGSICCMITEIPRAASFGLGSRTWSATFLCCWSSAFCDLRGDHEDRCYLK